MNWDDLKYFLAVCREGSIRAAAKHLDVNHATVSRRLNNFEKSLNQRLFERTQHGYVKTRAGDEIYQHAVHLEEHISRVQLMVDGQDRDMTGPIRVTAADIILHHLLMDILAEFAEQHPAIDIQIIESARSLNLNNREADIAVRVCTEPPDYLIGRKVAEMHRSVYVSSDVAKQSMDEGWVSQQNWIGWSDKMRRPIGKIAKDYPRFVSKHNVMNAGLQAIACRLGMGVAALPCFIGDQDPALSRVPPYTTEHKLDVWVLSHPDMRENARVKALVRYLNTRLEDKRALIEGNLG